MAKARRSGGTGVNRPRQESARPSVGKSAGIDGVTDDDALALFAVVRTIQRRVRMATTRSARSELLANLPEVEVEAVLVIGEQGGCTAGHMAATLQVAPTTATGIADRLVRRRLVTRRRSEEDRRSVWLHLTDKGERTLAAIRADQLGTCRQLLGTLPPDERGRLLAIFKAVGQALDRQGAGAL